MPGKVNQNVNPIVPDMVRNLAIPFSHRVVPVIRQPLDPFRHIIRLGSLRVAEYLHPGLVVGAD